MQACVKPTLPPGPSSRLAVLWNYFRDPYSLRFARYGDPVTLPLGSQTIVSTGDPELIKVILATDPESFSAYGKELFGPVMGDESLMLLDGARHKAARKLLAPPFHGARMRTYAEVMRTIAVDETRGWRTGVPVDAQRTTQAISLRVILRAVFGIADGPALREWEALLVELVDALKPTLLFLPFLQHSFGGLGPWARLQRLIGRAEQRVYDELARRRAEGGAREDILSLVMAARYDDGAPMTDRQVFETLMTLVAAGHETSAIALAWALWLVHRDTRVRERLLDEVRGAPDDAEAWSRLPYLEAVCLETLRLRPVATAVMRILAQPLTLGSWTLPAGVAVSPSIVALHRRPELYPEPEAFRPERFLERTFAPWEYLPFGGGSRRCIGSAFAMMEMKVVLAALLRAQPLRLDDERPVKVKPRNTTVGPARPIWLIPGERPAAS
jgi:cytochrome P450